MSTISDKKKKVKDWRVLEFFVPIEEKVFDEDTDEFLIRGVAINETTTLNNVKYIAEELERAAPTFRNVPILLDHRNEVKNIVGRTTANVNFNSANRRIDFEGKIMDKAIREMIKDGRIQSVSIGAKVNDLVDEKDGSKKATGIRGLELSLVAVPGDSQANLAQALQHNFHLKEKYGDDYDEDDEESDEDDFEDNAEKLNINKEGENQTMAEEEEKKEKIKTEEGKKEIPEVSELKNEIASLKELIATSFTELKKKTEEMKAVEVKEVKKDETKGEVSVTEEVKETPKDFVIESSGKGKGFSIYGDFSKNPNLKRLNR